MEDYGEVDGLKVRINVVTLLSSQAFSIRWFTSEGYRTHWIYRIQDIGDIKPCDLKIYVNLQTESENLGKKEGQRRLKLKYSFCPRGILILYLFSVFRVL